MGAIRYVIWGHNYNKTKYPFFSVLFTKPLDDTLPIFFFEKHPLLFPWILNYDGEKG